MTSTIREYHAQLVTGYLVVVSLIALLIQGMYREYFEAIMKLMFTEDYSYLLVAFFTVVLTLYLSLWYTGFSYEIRLSKVLSTLLLSAIATVFYYASRIGLDYSVQLMGLSFAVMVIAVVVLVFKPVSPGDVMPLITPLFTVPIPASILDHITVSLSRVVGVVAAALTGTKLVETQTPTMIEIAVNGGVRTLSVEAACSGIATLSTVIVISPLLTYYVTVSREKVSKKVATSALALITGFLIGFAGSSLKVVSMVLATKYYGIEAAMSVFNYSPSVICASLSVITVYALISKLARITRTMPRPLETVTGPPELRWEYVAGILLLLSLFISGMQVLVALPEKGLVEEAGTPVIEVGNVEDFIKNPTKYLIHGNAVVLDYSYDAFLTRVIGSSVTYRISVVADNVMYSGFLELVDTVGRLHTLQLSLSMQGYRVLNAWSEQRRFFRISYIVSEKGGVLYLLVYVLTPIIVKSTSGNHTFYARVSLMKQYTGAKDAEAASSTLLETLNIDFSSASWQDALSRLAIACSTCLAVLAVLTIYVFTTYLYNLVSRKRHGVV